MDGFDWFAFLGAKTGFDWFVWVAFMLLGLGFVLRVVWLAFSFREWWRLLVAFAPLLLVFLMPFTHAVVLWLVLLGVGALLVWGPRVGAFLVLALGRGLWALGCALLRFVFCGEWWRR